VALAFSQLAVFDENCKYEPLLIRFERSNIVRENYSPFGSLRENTLHSQVSGANEKHAAPNFVLLAKCSSSFWDV